MAAEALKVEGVSFLRSQGANRSPHRVILSDISFTIDRGERVALIGANGTGKSTLLRLLAGILQPTTGTVSRFGRVSSMLDPSFAMSDILSPLENCRTRLILEGIPTSNIPKIIRQIEEFAEIGEQFRHPMNTLSSGMWARVSFSLMTTLPHEIILIDEGFGLADRAFRKKSQARLGELYSGADALVLASHDSSLLRSVCRRGIVIKDQKVAFDGAVDEAVAFHET